MNRDTSSVWSSLLSVILSVFGMFQELDGPGLTVHVLGEPVLPAVLNVLQPAAGATGASGSFCPDQLAQFLDPVDVFDGRVPAAMPDDGGQVDRGAPLPDRRF